MWGMAFPLKYKHLLEMSHDQVEKPTHAWLSYAVCAVEEDSCCWQGWILEGVFKDDLVLPSDDFSCPKCQRPLFRTDVAYKMDLSVDQAPPLVEGRDYVTSEMEYTDT